MSPNLFKVFEAVPDKTFTAFILKKNDDYNEGLDMTVQCPMKLAENKYHMFVQDGLWQVPAKQAEKIIGPDQGTEGKKKDFSKQG